MSGPAVKPALPLIKIGEILMAADRRLYVRFSGAVAGAGPLVLLESRSLSAAQVEARKLAAEGIAP